MHADESWAHQRSEKFTRALTWLATQFGVCDRAEFARQFPPDGPAVLDGLVSLGYVQFSPRLAEYNLTPAGWAREKAKADPVGMETAQADAPDPRELYA